MIPKAAFATIGGMSLDRRTRRRFPLRMGIRYRLAGLSLPVGWTAGESLNLSSTGLLFSGADAVLTGQKIEALIDWPARLNNRGDLGLALEGVIVRCGEDRTAMRVDHYEFRLRNSPQQA